MKDDFGFWGVAKTPKGTHWVLGTQMLQRNKPVFTLSFMLLLSNPTSIHLPLSSPFIPPFNVNKCDANKSKDPMFVLYLFTIQQPLILTPF